MMPMALTTTQSVLAMPPLADYSSVPHLSGHHNLIGAQLNAPMGSWDSAERSHLPYHVSPRSQAELMSMPSAADVDYPSPTSMPSPTYVVHAGAAASHSPRLDPSCDVLPPFTQLRPSIGPSRTQTRGRHRMDPHVRRISPTENAFADKPPRMPDSDYLVTPPDDEPLDGSSVRALGHPSSPTHIRDGLSMDGTSHTHGHHNGQPYPATPDSPPNVSPVGYRSSYSRSERPDLRSTSPALSIGTVGSAADGAHSASYAAPFARSPENSPTQPARPKHRKQRLWSTDKKKICLYARDHPNARQEDIANQYKVERSTISKILKNRGKWLNVDDNEEMRIAKHRPTKFPEIEFRMVDWLHAMTTADPTYQFTDSLIRMQARAIADEYGITEERFKASSGWVENFKHRHGVRGGRWDGFGTNTRRARAMGLGAARTKEAIEEEKLQLARDRAREAASNEDVRMGDSPTYPPEAHDRSPTLSRPNWSETPSSGIVDANPSVESSYVLVPSSAELPRSGHSSESVESLPAPRSLDPTLDQRPTHLTAAPDYSHPDSTRGLDIYQTGPPQIHDHGEESVPTAKEAEAHFDKFVRFLHSDDGQGIATPEDFQRFRKIREALFQRARELETY